MRVDLIQLTLSEVALKMDLMLKVCLACHELSQVALPNEGLNLLFKSITLIYSMLKILMVPTILPLVSKLEWSFHGSVFSTYCFAQYAPTP